VSKHNRQRRSQRRAALYLGGRADDRYRPALTAFAAAHGLAGVQPNRTSQRRRLQAAAGRALHLPARLRAASDRRVRAGEGLSWRVITVHCDRCRSEALADRTVLTHEAGLTPPGWPTDLETGRGQIDLCAGCSAARDAWPEQGRSGAPTIAGG
jgi:hypothetical protein